MNFDDPSLRDIFASFGKNKKAEIGGYHNVISYHNHLCLKILSSKFNYAHCNTHKKNKY